jgi:type III secretion system YscQ/HrcQ family protein
VSKGPSGTVIDAKAVKVPPRGARVRPFVFRRLEKVSRSQIELLRRLQWLLPDGMLTGEMAQPVKERLRRLFDEDVLLWLDYVHALEPRALGKVTSEPTFLAVLAPTPHGARGLIEVELALAHSVIDLLLGAAGEPVMPRPLTEIESGVMSYILLETFKALAPPADEPGRHRLRLERVVGSLEEGLAMFGDERSVALVELKCVVGPAAGYIRLMIPASALNAAAAPEDSPHRRVLRLTRVQRNLKRLSTVRVPLRVEIGQAEILAQDLAALRSGDVVLLDRLTARCDKGEPGTAALRIGMGRAGRIDAALSVSEGRYQAKVERVVLGVDLPPMQDESAAAALAAREKAAFESFPRPAPPEPARQAEGVTAEEKVPNNPGADGLWADDEKTHVTDISKVVENLQANAAELLNDVPLHVVVELGRIPVTAEEVVSLHVGKVLEIGRAPGEPVDLSVNGKIVARGELVEVEGQLGVRISGLAE